MAIAPGYKRLSQEQVRVFKNIEAGLSGKALLARALDDALEILAGEMPTNIPQANVQNLVSNLADKLAVAAFTDAAVTSKLIAGFVSGAGAVAVGDTILQAINKLDGNVATKLTASKLVSYTGTIPAGSATPTAVVTGLAVGDTILAVSQKAVGVTGLPLLGFGAISADALPLVYSADPGANGTIVVTVLKA